MGQAEMVLQLCLCTVLLRYVLGDVDFNLLDGFRYDKATVKMGESAIFFAAVSGGLVICVAGQKRNTDLIRSVIIHCSYKEVYPCSYYNLSYKAMP